MRLLPLQMIDLLVAGTKPTVHAVASSATHHTDGLSATTQATHRFIHHCDEQGAARTPCNLLTAAQFLLHITQCRKVGRCSMAGALQRPGQLMSFTRQVHTPTAAAVAAAVTADAPGCCHACCLLTCHSCCRCGSSSCLRLMALLPPKALHTTYS